MNPKLNPLHPTNNNKTMNTTNTMNPGVAISLAQTSTSSAPADNARLENPPVTGRKSLVLGFLTVASCAAGVLCFKAAIIIGYLMASLNNLYDSIST